jgi:hypothetical protein
MDVVNYTDYWYSGIEGRKEWDAILTVDNKVESGAAVS